MPKVNTTTHFRIDGVRKVTLNDATTKKVNDFISENPGLTVDQISMATDVVVWRINAILECTPGGIANVKNYLVAPPARGFDPAWTKHVSNPKLLPKASNPGRALVVASAPPSNVTASFILEDRDELDLKLRQLIAATGKAPKKKKKLYAEMAEIIDYQAQREQENYDKLTTVSEALAESHAAFKQEQADAKRERAQLLALLGSKGQKISKALAAPEEA